MDESQKDGAATSPIDSEIKNLFAKVDHLYKQLNRVLASVTGDKVVPPKSNSLLSDLTELNEKLGDILDRLQV